jgi:hypothetical protein
MPTSTIAPTTIQRVGMCQVRAVNQSTGQNRKPHRGKSERHNNSLPSQPWRVCARTRLAGFRQRAARNGAGLRPLVRVNAGVVPTVMVMNWLSDP